MPPSPALLRRRPLHIASCSFGKDSIATALLALERGEPLDELIYCHVRFDAACSGEVPEHRQFIFERAIPYFAKRGIPTRVLTAEDTYVSCFCHVVSKGRCKGKISAFPLCGRCSIQRDCKVRPIRAYQKQLPPDTVQYIGYAHDEQERLLRLEGSRISLLDKYQMTERDARLLCQQHGLLSPVYEFSDRGGCWFCPNAKDAELRHLYEHHPDLWQRMLALQALPNKATERFNRSETFAQIDERFKLEDAQLTLEQYMEQIATKRGNDR